MPTPEVKCKLKEIEGQLQDLYGEDNKIFDYVVSPNHSQLLSSIKHSDNDDHAMEPKHKSSI